jgi:ATP-dependent DNA helicase RecG
MDEIEIDLLSPYNMNRLVQGDVGSGKTIISALAMMKVIENGYQSALMAPTEVLAKQHYISLKEIFEPYGIEVGLLVGSMTKKQKNEVYQALEDGKILLVIGTHAVIQEGVVFNDLALVVTDEQHRFGVKQREVLAGKGHYPHVLVMSATPIPRTLALILYGDMDVSIIDEMPPGRQVIDTYSVTSAYRERIQQFILKEIEKGRQIYIVCPMVEENESLELANVISYTEDLKQALPTHIKIQTLHGKMRPKEKNDIMASFVAGEQDVLVSTTVIEVGINVPNASVMVIEDAHRFGLAQLHQLRGRVGRGSDKSYCVLMTDSKSGNSKKRMAIMTDTTDGFVIAEKDLELRGHGDLLGLRQSGMPTFKIAHILEDASILKEANKVAKTITEKHDILLEDDYKALNQKIENYMETYMSYIAL